VSLDVRAGEIVGLVGESGSGKTLTCRAALGLLPAGCAVERGTVSFAGRDVTALSRREWERVHGSHIGAVFQDPASYLNPSITVGSQLTEVLRVKLGLRRGAARQRAIELFEAVGLRHAERVFHQIPAELSGGMLQRVMIAIAISGNPRLLVADRRPAERRLPSPRGMGTAGGRPPGELADPRSLTTHGRTPPCPSSSSA
jgi:peptide/nickel transport system ATP-binding protein